MINSNVSLATLLLLLASAPVSAETTTESSGQCAQTFRQCKAQCSRNYPDDTAQRAPCVTVCSGRYAACDASAAYDSARPWLDETLRNARPWLEEQSQKAKNLFDDLMKEYAPESSAAPPPPQKKTRDNSI